MSERFRGMGRVAMMFYISIFLLIFQTWEMNEWMEMEIKPSSISTEEEGGVGLEEDSENKGEIRGGNSMCKIPGCHGSYAKLCSRG